MVVTPAAKRRPSRSRAFTLSLKALLPMARSICRWHFQPGGGPDYCDGCRRQGLACASGRAGPGRLCPYRAHALVSQEEHQAWDVLSASVNQVRLAPTGRVLGLEPFQWIPPRSIRRHRRLPFLTADALDGGRRLVQYAWSDRIDSVTASRSSARPGRCAVD